MLGLAPDLNGAAVRPGRPALFWLPATLLPVLLVGGACGDRNYCRNNTLQICDIDSLECQDQVFRQTACARNHPGEQAPTVFSITRSEFEDLLRRGGEPTAAQVLADGQRATSLRMLTLLPAGSTSNEEASIQALVDSVIAFYTREDQTVTIISSNVRDDETGVFVLSHEFVHAQQDVDFGLDDFFSDHATSTDSVIGVRSVTEGEAVHYSNLTMSRRPGVELDQAIYDDYYAGQHDQLEFSTADPMVGFTELTSIFPYPFGGQMVTDRWFDRGDLGVHEFYDEPPRSAAEVLALIGGDPAPAPDVPMLTMGSLPAGWEAVVEDTLGSWLVFAVAQRLGLDEGTARALRSDWRGDHLLVAGGATETEVALAWRIRWGSESSATAFAGIDASTAPEGAMSITADGRDATVVIAGDPAMLETWEETFAATVDATPSSLRSSSLAGRLAPPLPRPRVDGAAHP